METKRPIPEFFAEVVHRSDNCEFARRLGMVVTEIADGCVRVTMPTAGMKNGHGTVHGGAIFAIADHAFGIAGNLDEVEETGLSAHIRYFSPPAGGTLEAVARRVAETERTSVYAVDVYSDGRPVASFEGIGFKVGAQMKRA